MVNGVGGYGGLKMGGLATGLETDDIIKKMLAGQQAKIDKAKQERQQIQWKQEMYRDIIKDVKDLQNTYFDIMSKDNLASEKAFYDYEVKSSNESVITASAGQGAIDGNYTVKVEQLATGARATAALGNDTTKSTQLSVVAEQLKNIGIENYKDGFEIKVAGKTFKVNGLSDDSTVEDLVNAIKNASDEDDSKEKLSNYVDVSFSEITKEFIIETKETGKDQTIEIGGKNATEAGSIKKGQDAKISVVTPKSEKNEDGTYKSYEITNAKNNFTLDGITFNLKGISKEGETANLNVTKDVDKTFDRFKEFIDKYNSLVGNIKGKLTEKKAYSYKPLTEEQKKEMKEDDIKKWEEKAKQGILRNDPNLEKMLRELRGTFFASVDGAGESFGRHIGLDTTNDYKTAGQIKFTEGGEEKFKKALLERPEDIMNLFTKKPDKNFLKEIENNKSLSQAEKDKKIYDNSGIFTRMDNILRNYVGAPGTTLNNSILTKYANKQEDHSTTGAIGANNLPDQIYRKDNLIKELDKKLREREERLYKQFATLEKAMTKYNAQAGWLSQQFGGGM
ncbi:flagellar filament capping protein FliD [Clostridium cochlearium]|uniref:flagellar filament capping protein FliD n=1 Tax=Clostridium cochlearium TaxID=1494 RepID=UPI001EE0DEAF|nr:flagellar filament capping protein FliD [Clostridium cochlearium]MBV1821032.1 flagellar filament capping protein FliD [Bacteroidales bacterium MSK.15.36]MCG4571619.1 flagellar filament capping protein FliD [Clostridium cochlearium]MCG4580681.1 flagellar filament capping protein FliD [Clostridium cochlearium]